MDVPRYLDHRRVWQTAAPAAADALRGGRPGPCGDLLIAEGVVVRDHVDALLQALSSSSPSPDGPAWQVALGDVTGDGPTAMDWRESAWRGAKGPAGDPLAWAIAELCATGWLVEHGEREPWRRSWAVDPRADREVAELWRAWTEARPWDIREAWEARFLKLALRAFSAVVRGRRLPEEVRHQALRDAREGFFYALLGDGKTGSGWRELAVRLLESAGGDPVDALAQATPADEWERVARCAVTRGHGRATAQAVWGEGVAWQVQARDLQRQGRASSQTLGQLLSLHLSLRLVDVWQQPERTSPQRTAAVVAHNRGRARSRLRAVLREAPAEHLGDCVAAMPALAARTQAAVARFARDWAWQQVQHGFSFYDARTVDPACLLPVGAPPPMSADDKAALGAWVLRVALKERLPHLRQWVHGGESVDKRDTTWGRLLSDDCPERLRSYKGASRAEGLARLRAELSDGLPGILRRAQPVLAEVAGIPTSARDKGLRFDQALAPLWHDSVPVLKVRYTSYIQAAVKAVVTLEAP